MNTFLLVVIVVLLAILVIKAHFAAVTLVKNSNERLAIARRLEEGFNQASAGEDERTEQFKRQLKAIQGVGVILVKLFRKAFPYTPNDVNEEVAELSDMLRGLGLPQEQINAQIGIQRL